MAQITAVAAWAIARVTARTSPWPTAPLESASTGVRVGYGRNPIRNCVFQNLVIYNSHRGLGVFARDEGNIENLLFQNITIRTRLYSGHWWGKGEPIHVSAIRQNPAVPVGRIRRVTFSNILADSEGGVVVYGTPKSPIEDLTIHNLRLTVTAGPLAAGFDSTRSLPEPGGGCLGSPD